MAFNERMINTHRETVRGSLWNRLSVMHTLFALHALETIWLGYLIFVTYIFETRYVGTGFRTHCILHGVFMVLSMMAFIPGTFWLLASLPFHIFKIMHPLFVYGIFIERLLVWIPQQLAGGRSEIFAKLLIVSLYNGITGCFFSMPLKPFLSMIVLWYHLVLERIRSENGTGLEFKTALELQMETAMANKTENNENTLSVPLDDFVEQ
ncbi:uncharacterized protein BXIN_0550 [Babesia sp. Xinjiang]|uniref:uncharacterized protein n=1 Tax=Babesia sp. Xinjiang TaxID=462227 RepID=UPI000A21E996|nr:uncharacterized protein BXIN_0550 [Babesia sp. Xinjiang]ORM41947.1 hypothetical protein BXIN_0550 [Babesia sp. Xinjiang]